MACSKCGKDGHNKVTCTKTKSRKSQSKKQTGTLNNPFTLAFPGEGKKILKIWSEGKSVYSVETMGMKGKEVTPIFRSNYPSKKEAIKVAKDMWRGYRKHFYPYANFKD